MRIKSDKNEREEKFSTLLILICGLCIFGISLVIHQKDFYDMNAYGTTQPIANASNLFTYYKVLLMGWLVLGLSIALIFRKITYKSPFRIDYVTVFCGMIIIGALISILYNPIGYMRWIGFFMRTNGFLAYLFLYLFLYLLSNFSCNNRVIAGAISIITVFIILTTLIGLFQFMGMDIYNSLFIRRLIINGEVGTQNIANTKVASAAFSVFAHYNYYSGFCAIFFPFMISVTLEEKRKRFKILYGVSVLLLSLGVVTSSSQSGIYTLLLVSVVAVFFLGRKDTWKELLLILLGCAVLGVGLAKTFNVQAYQELAPRLISWIASPMHLLIILAIGVLVIGVTYLKNRFLKSGKAISVLVILFATLLITTQTYLICIVAKNHTHMFTDRGYAWVNTYELLKESPVIGYGPDNFYYAFPQDNPDAKNYSNGSAYDKPHNMLLQMYMDTGLVGLLGFIALLIGMMLSIVNHQSFIKENIEGLFLRGVLLMIMAYMIQGVVNDNHITIQPMLFFAFAICISITRKKNEIAISRTNK